MCVRHTVVYVKILLGVGPFSVCFIFAEGPRRPPAVRNMTNVVERNKRRGDIIIIIIVNPTVAAFKKRVARARDVLSPALRFPGVLTR